MERIDIKLFKANNKYRVVNGALQKLGLRDTLEGKEIEFYNIAAKDITNLNEYKDITDLYFYLVPILTNVKITISKEEFNYMLENQTVIFEEFFNAFNENLKDVMASKKKGIQVNQDINKFLKDNGIDVEALKELEQQQQVKGTKVDIEKKIQELYEAMKTDKEHRAEILEKIDILEKELSELNE